MRSGLRRRPKPQGARIFENTPALSIDIEGVRKRIATPKARVRATRIVLAGNVHLGALMPRIAGTLVPIWSYLVTTAPLGPQLAEAIDYRGAVTDTDLADNHYRIVGGDRLLWSGRSTTWEDDPKWYARRLQWDISKIYPQLGEVEIEHVWSGVLGNALHRMPQLGELSPGLWIASGFGGHGLNTTAMAGNILARAIVDGDDTWRLFSPYEFVWAGGRLGRAIMQVYYWWFSARERFEARQSREREREYGLAAERAALQAEASEEPRTDTLEPAIALPAEPDLAELPADPVMADAPVPIAPPIARLGALEPADFQGYENAPPPAHPDEPSLGDDGPFRSRAALRKVSYDKDPTELPESEDADRSRERRPV